MSLTVAHPQANTAPQATLPAGQPQFASWVTDQAARKTAQQTERVFQYTKGLIHNTQSEGGKTPNGLKKFFANFVALDESVLGASAILFVQDTLSVWLPKMTAMRSAAEAVETTFLEFVESALFYFSAPLLGQHLFSKIVHNVLPDNKPGSASRVIRNDIAASLKDINKTVNLDHLAKNFHSAEANTAIAKQAKKLIGLKAGTVVATLSAMMLEYTLSFAKNLITAKFFKTGDFNDVANLGTATPKTEKELLAAQQNIEKANRRLWQGAIAALGFLGAGLGLAVGSTRNKTLFNISRKLLKSFDFSYTQVFARKGKAVTDKIITKFGLTRGQKIAIITLGGIGYLDASRNKLEVYENLFRVWGVVMPFLMFGKEFLTERLRRVLHGEKRLTGLLKALQPSEETIAKFRRIYEWDPKKNHGKGGGTYYSVAEIAEQALKKAGLESKLGENVSVADATRWIASNDPKLKQAGIEFWKMMNPKLVSFAAPLMVGIFGVGLTVAWLNRFWTNIRFERQQAQTTQTRFKQVAAGLNTNGHLQQTPSEKVQKHFSLFAAPINTLQRA